MTPKLTDTIAPKAVILAAGISRRLGEVDKPKAMLDFGGATLISRHISILRARGVTDITVVVGFEEGYLREELAAAGSPAVAVIVNPDFREGSVVSLWSASSVLRSGAPIVLMDADVLYDARLMSRLLQSEHPNCFLLDREIEPGDEPVKLCIAGNAIVDFRKRPEVAYEWHGESVGFFRFTAETSAELADRAHDYVTSGRRGMEYEEPIRDMVLNKSQHFGFEDISGLPWTEIDFPEDVVKARALLPKLGA